MLTFVEEKFTNIKIKKLTLDQLVISIDRLTRFKYTEDKYLRVFKEIVLSNLIEPKFKKKDLDEIDYDTIRDCAQFIFNESIDMPDKDDYFLNQRLIDYENAVFNLSSEINKLLYNKISYKGFLQMIEGRENLPNNILWLKMMNENPQLSQDELRNNYNLHFPIKKLVIAEGITEEILLPEFAKHYGTNFDKLGIHVISAGGKNQVVKLYYKFAELLKLPIYVLLDSDAEDNLLQIKPRLRNIDTVQILNNGEFEDILSHSLILKTLNNHFANFTAISNEELEQDLPMVKILEEFFKRKGFHEFKKAEFAQLVKSQIRSKSDISENIVKLLNGITSLPSAVL